MNISKLPHCTRLSHLGRWPSIGATFAAEDKFLGLEPISISRPFQPWLWSTSASD